MRRLVVLSTLLFAVAACDTVGPVDRTNVDVSTLSQDGSALLGTTWGLVTITPSGECVGENCSATRTAQEAGQSALIEFRADGRGTFTYDGAVLAEGDYDVRYREYSNGTRSDLPLLFIGGESFNFGLDGDRLYVDDRYLDGPLLEFQRITYVAY